MAELPSTTKRPFADHKESDSAPGSTKRCRLESFAQVQPEPLPPLRLPSFLEPVEQASLGHPYCTDSVATFVTQWLEPDSYRERHCRSETSLNRFDRDIIPRRLTKSVPGMADRKDRQRFVMPPTPDSRSQRAESDTMSRMPSHAPPSTVKSFSTSASRTDSLVKDPNYRRFNLVDNQIFMRRPNELLPQHVTHLLDDIRRDRDSPGPSLEQIRQDENLHDLELGLGEGRVENYFRAAIFPGPEREVTQSIRLPMVKQAVPDTGSKQKISNPSPDLLYGYTDAAMQSLPTGTDSLGNNEGLFYPFFAVEFKADGPSSAGSLWVATNQCLAASAACVNIAERLNRQLKQCNSVQQIDSAAFSIAMSGTEARLYVSWKHEEFSYFTQKVNSFALQEPEDYLRFRKYVRNIIDWGKDKRLDEIKESLNILLEENRKAASQLAKSRQPPSAASSSSNKRLKHASSSSCGRGRPDTSVQGCDTDVDEAATEGEWIWEPEFKRYYTVDSQGQLHWAEMDR